MQGSMFYFFLSFVGVLVVVGEIIQILKIEFYRIMTVFSATKTVHPNYGEKGENNSWLFISLVYDFWKEKAKNWNENNAFYY